MGDTAAAVAKLKSACDAAYDGNKESCSHAVMHVIHAVLYQDMEHLNANGLIGAKGKKNLTLPRTKQYPRALSTSIGNWPGAMSKGDKTVWDPWANDSKFDEVCFWAEANIWEKAPKAG